MTEKQYRQREKKAVKNWRLNWRLRRLCFRAAAMITGNVNPSTEGLFESGREL